MKFLYIENLKVLDLFVKVFIIEISQSKTFLLSIIKTGIEIYLFFISFIDSLFSEKLIFITL